MLHGLMAADVFEAEAVAEEKGADRQKGPQKPGQRTGMLLCRQDDDVLGHVVGAVGQDALHRRRQGQGRGHEDRGGAHADAVKEEGRAGETLGAVFRPKAHVLPLPDAEGHGMSLAVPLGPLVDEKHAVAPGKEALGPAAEIPDAQAPIAVAADVDRMARLAGVPVPCQLQPVPGGDVHPLMGQGKELLDEADHEIVLRVVLLPRGQVLGHVLRAQGGIEHEAIDAEGSGQQQKQQKDKDEHGDLRSYCGSSIPSFPQRRKMSPCHRVRAPQGIEEMAPGSAISAGRSHAK